MSETIVEPKDIFRVDEWTPQEAADHIKVAWQDAVESIIETGRRLIEAKEKVRPGQWLATVELLPFSERTARYLMDIAKHPDLANRHHGSDLPASWRTLSILAQLPEGEIPKLIGEHQITAELERSEAEALVIQFKASEQVSLNMWSQACDNLMALESYASSNIPPRRMPPSHRTVTEFKDRLSILNSTIQNWRTDEQPEPYSAGPATSAGE